MNLDRTLLAERAKNTKLNPLLDLGGPIALVGCFSQIERGACRGGGSGELACFGIGGGERIEDARIVAMAEQSGLFRQIQ